MTLRWIVAGGGTGGHVSLALALGEVIAERGEGLLFLGSDAGQESRLVPAAGFDLVALPSRQVMGRGIAGRALGALGVLRATLRARGELARFGANAVISVGGYAGLPAALAAAMRGTPLGLVEPNAIPGRSNRLTARFATRVYTGFEAANARLARAARDRVRCLGVPLRRSIVTAFGGATPRGVPVPPFHLLVFGGSQGARQINDGLIEAAPHLAGAPVEIFHQTGTADRDRVEDAYTKAGVTAQVVAYEDDMAARYRWAHFAIGRAGALSVAELGLCGLPALLVPYPWAADDHQAANARALEDTGAARRLEAGADHRLAGETVASAVRELCEAPESLARMSAAALQGARPHAAADIIQDFAHVVAPATGAEGQE